MRSLFEPGRPNVTDDELPVSQYLSYSPIAMHHLRKCVCGDLVVVPAREFILHWNLETFTSN